MTSWERRTAGAEERKQTAEQVLEGVARAFQRSPPTPTHVLIPHLPGERGLLRASHSQGLCTVLGFWWGDGGQAE